MENPEYMKVHISNFPPDIIEKYGLLQLQDENGFIYSKIKKDMYKLKIKVQHQGFPYYTHKTRQFK